MPCLDGLPFDILYGIALYGDVEDIVNLHNTSRQLRFLLLEEVLCRKLLEYRANSTLEARDAKTTGYGAAIRRLFKRRAAMAAGRPATVVSLGYAVDAIYADGVLCLMGQSYIDILNLHGDHGRQQVNIKSMLGSITTEDSLCDWTCVQLLSYQQGILVFGYTDSLDANWLMAADVSQPSDPQLAMEPERLRSITKLFVLQTPDFIFHGTRSATARWCSQPFREWLIQGICLTGERFTIPQEDGTVVHSAKSERIQLHGFAGSEIGSTAAFKIHDGYFYAVTNYDAFDVIEVDFTSYYHCIRFPVEDAQQVTCHAARTIFRRQHEDGPVNDGWNTLDLQVDERTKGLVIVEGRAEWLSGDRKLSRGVYSHKLNWDEHEIEVIPDLETKYCPTPNLPTWYDHMETESERHPLTHAAAISTTLSRSKFRGYHFSTMTTLELVEHPCNCRNTDAFCMHLRSSSRRPFPNHSPGEAMRSAKGKVLEPQGPIDPKVARASAYKYAPISIWPNESERMHEIMSLPRILQGVRSSEVRVWMDERFVIYFISSGGVGKVVCLSFDGDLPLQRFADNANAPALALFDRQRGRSPRQQPDLEHTRQISPARDAWDHPIFETNEAREGFFVSTWDLEGIKDVHELDVHDLEPWFKSFGSSSDIEMTSS